MLAATQRHLGGPDLGDVVDQHDEAANPPAGVQLRDVRGADVTGGTVLVDEPVVERDLLAGEGPLHVGPDHLPRGRPEHVAQVAPANALRRVVEPAAVALVGPDVSRVAVDVGDERGHRVGHEPQLLRVLVHGMRAVTSLTMLTIAPVVQHQPAATRHTVLAVLVQQAPARFDGLPRAERAPRRRDGARPRDG